MWQFVRQPMPFNAFEPFRQKVQKEAKPLSGLASGHFLISNAAQSAYVDVRQLVIMAKVNPVFQNRQIL